MQDRGCSPMSPSGMDDSDQDSLLASGWFRTCVVCCLNTA